jgi:hypothetical protein
MFDGSSLIRNESINETLQLMSDAVTVVAMAVEFIDREGFEDCFVIDLTTGFEEIQVEMMSKSFSSPFCDYAAAMTFHG